MSPCPRRCPLSKIASEGLKHRVFEVSLADLQKDEDQAFRKIHLRAEDVQGRNVVTNIRGMDFTTDKLRSLVRKWKTLIEAHVDVKTTDNYTLRMFYITFTKKHPNQQKRKCYAQSSQIRQIHRKMVEILRNQATSYDLKELVEKFIPEVLYYADTRLPYLIQLVCLPIFFRSFCCGSFFEDCKFIELSSLSWRKCGRPTGGDYQGPWNSYSGRNSMYEPKLHRLQIPTDKSSSLAQGIP